LAERTFGWDRNTVQQGLHELRTGLLTIIFGVSFETSDFIVDCLEQWWNVNKERYAHINQLVINLGNGWVIYFQLPKRSYTHDKRLKAPV
jgi:hypothetical protein